MDLAARTLLETAAAEFDAQAAESPNAERLASWRRGDLAFKLLPHQRKSYAAFRDWNTYRQTPEYAAMVERVGARYDDVFMNYAGRRVGKTSETILVLVEQAISLPIAGLMQAAALTYFTAFQKDITEIIVPLADELLQDCPKDLVPEYHRSKGAHGMGLYFPNGSICKLVGVDKNPDGLRGRFSDGMAGSEVAFMKTTLEGRGLTYVIKSVLLPQFVRRPWAFLILETSAPKDPEHPVLTEFKPDCESRGALIERVLEDNTSIDELEYRKIVRQAGGEDDPDFLREYRNVVARDPSQYVIPEWTAERNEREVKRPRAALCYTIADPGDADLFGLLFCYADFDSDRMIAQRAWARRNASTRQVAAVIAYYEWALWGREPPAEMRDIPAQRSGGRDGWAELLVGTELAGQMLVEVAHVLHRLCNLPEAQRMPTVWPVTGPDECFTYWDSFEERAKQNPFARFSDTDLRFIRDLTTDFGLDFSATAKDDAGAQRQSFRNAVGAGKVIALPEASNFSAHVKNAIWPEKGPREGTKWDRHPVYGHYDLLACGIYGWRNADRTKNPYTPALRLVGSRSSTYVPRGAEDERTSDDDLAEGLLGAPVRGRRPKSGGSRPW